MISISSDSVGLRVEGCEGPTALDLALGWDLFAEAAGLKGFSLGPVQGLGLSAN